MRQALAKLFFFRASFAFFLFSSFLFFLYFFFFFSFFLSFFRSFFRSFFFRSFFFSIFFCFFLSFSFFLFFSFLSSFFFFLSLLSFFSLGGAAELWAFLFLSFSRAATRASRTWRLRRRRVGRLGLSRFSRAPQGPGFGVLLGATLCASCYGLCSSQLGTFVSPAAAPRPLAGCIRDRTASSAGRASACFSSSNRFFSARFSACRATRVACTEER